MTTDTTAIDPQVMALCREIDRYWRTWNAYSTSKTTDTATIADVEERERDVLAAKIALTRRLAKPSADTIEREMKAVLDAWAAESRYHNYIAGDEALMVKMLTDRVFELVEGRIEE